MITIDKLTGAVNVNGFEIKSTTTIDDLPMSFEIGKEMIVQVGRRKIPCTFSSYNEITDNIETKVNLRFEKNELVSLFIHLIDLSKKHIEADDFYSSISERKKLHLNWLQLKLGERQSSYTVYRWGSVGVAQDRSDNVHIFLHNQNNSLVRRS